MNTASISPLLVLVPVRSANQAEPLFLQPLGDRVVLDLTLDAAERQKERVDTTLVLTTDDERIANYVGKHRPEWRVRMRGHKAEKGDYFSALKYAFEWASEDAGAPFETILILEPSHPFRPEGLIGNALNLMAENAALDSVVSVVREYGNLWTRSTSGELTRTVTRAGEEFYREVAGLALLNRRGAMADTGVMGHDIGFVVVEEQWALIDIHGSDGLAMAKKFHHFLSEGKAGD